jgi:NADH-quinone oxidoreductase subunit M
VIVWWIATPLIGALLVGLAGLGGSEGLRKGLWRLVAGLQVVVALWMITLYQEKAPLEVTYQLFTLAWKLPWGGYPTPQGWVQRYDVSLFFATDGVALILAAAVTLVGLILSWWPHWKLSQSHLQIPALLLVQGFALWAIFSYDLISFYIGFEATLIPMLYLIFTLIPDKQAARVTGMSFLLYTLAGSIPFLIGILYGATQMSALHGIPFTTDYVAWLKYPLPPEGQWPVYLGFVLAFYIKLGLFPGHGWVLWLYRHAPLPLVVLSSAILTKLGATGWLRWAPAFPHGHLVIAPYIGGIAAIGILLAGLGAYFQKTLRGWLSYSTISHLGYLAVGIAATGGAGFTGTAWYMIGHVVVAAAHLLIVGGLIERVGTDEIAHLGGLAKSLPRLSFFWVLIAMASIGLPGLSQFSAEFLVLVGSYQSYAVQRGVFLAALAGVAIGAIYTVRVLRMVLFGSPSAEPADFSLRESVGLGLLGIWVILTGVWAAPFLAEMERTLIPLAQAILAQALGVR